MENLEGSRNEDARLAYLCTKYENNLLTDPENQEWIEASMYGDPRARTLVTKKHQNGLTSEEQAELDQYEKSYLNC